jgi:hypothetical protein
MGFVVQALFSSTISSVIICIIAFMTRHWIKELLTQGIKYKFEENIAKLKAELHVENQKKLEAIKNELALSSSIKMEEYKAILGAEYEVYKSKDLRYIEKQFELYNDLWTSLADLEMVVNDLWEASTASKVKSFAEQIITTRHKIRKAALLIEDSHYLGLNNMLDQFQEFQFGKQKLLDLKSMQVSDEEIEFNIGFYIESNKIIKDRLLQTLTQMMNCLKAQIRR